MDAQQALSDLTEISSQIQAAVVFDEVGKVAASTYADPERADEFARTAARLLDEAAPITTGDAALTQIEAATAEGSVFVVRDGPRRIAATTVPRPTVGLVFYDLKSALRQISAKPPRARPARKTTAKTTSSAPKKATATSKPKPQAQQSTKPQARRKTTPRKKPDAP